MHEANDTDYLIAQGGKPRLVKNGPSFLVIHDYEGGSKAIVPTTPEQLRQIVDLKIKGRPVRFFWALLWQFHGKPCETTSRKNGGQGYQRLKSTSK